MKIRMSMHTAVDRQLWEVVQALAQTRRYVFQSNIHMSAPAFNV